MRVTQEQLSHAPPETEAPGWSRNAVGPKDGAEAFLRIVDSGLSGHVLVSPRPIAALVREASEATASVASRKKPRKASSQVDVRPVEEALEEHDAVAEAAVLAASDVDGGVRLVAFVAFGSGEHATVSEIRRHVRGRVASELVPKNFVELAELPRDAEGRLLRAELRDPFAEVDDYVAPRTPTEEALAAIWKDLLGLDRVSVHDNFLDVGGHSLVGIRAIARTEKETGVRLNANQLTLQDVGSARRWHREGRRWRGCGGRATGRGADPRRTGARGIGVRGRRVSFQRRGGLPVPRQESHRGTMNPFYFGPSDRPLYGVFSQARGVSTRPRAVLLCYPVLGEYLRAHRAFRQLNNLLNREGMSVLRFDYSCTGDSAGAGEDARLDAWIDDIGWAADELKDMVGLDELSVVGLRFGGTLAVLAAEKRPDVRRLVLWDPIVSGADFVRQAIGNRPVPPDETVGVEGVPLTPALRSDIEQVDLVDVAGTRDRVTDIVVSESDSTYGQLLERRRTDGEEVSLEVVPSSGSWTKADPFGSAYIPEQIIRTIVDRLSGKRAGVAS
ncbi:MAG: phosphopantetheine-binding protein [Gemmatimonadota bacterium]|nr:phosphopantetheine-binding protein [Gemmatimonadota bacterium]